MEIKDSSNGNAKFMSTPSIITVLVSLICVLLTMGAMNKWISADLSKHTNETHKLTDMEISGIKGALIRIENNQATSRKEILDKIDELK
jgi:hypothetical protein